MATVSRERSAVVRTVVPSVTVLFAEIGSASAVAVQLGSGSGSGSSTLPVLDVVHDTKGLTARYAAVGRALDALVRDRGEDVAEPLKRRYLSIPYVDALRDPSLRGQVADQLAALSHDIAAQQ